ncbi:MAG: lysostaphin resistance A-like protein [Methyloligellaceae bacterium]
MSQKNFLYLTVLSEGLLLCTAIILAWYFSIPLWSRISIELTDVSLGVAVALAMAIFAIWALKSDLALFSQLKKDTRHVVRLLQDFGIAPILCVSMAAGLCEELLFRGVFQILFTDWFGLSAGLVLASFFFGLAHMISLSYVIYVSIFGLALGCMYVWTGNLLGPIIAHFLYDLIMLYWAVRIQWPASGRQ